MCERRTARCEENRSRVFFFFDGGKKRDVDAMETFLIILFEFDDFLASTRALRDDDDLFFSGRRGISRFLSFSFPFGRSVDKTTTTTTTHPSGGVRRGPLRSIASSSSSRARERERENQKTTLLECISESLSLVDQKTCVPKKAPFLLVKLTDPFVFFYPRLIVKIL